jgi:hypothetical protein
MTFFHTFSPQGRGEQKPLEILPSPPGRAWSRGAGPGEGAGRWPLVLAATVLVLVAGAGVAWFLSQHRHAPTQLVERQLTANPPEDWVTGAAISPDGKHLAYNDQTGLYLRSIDSGEITADGRRLSFLKAVWA